MYEERQVTVAGTTHRLPPLFMVLATQNPIEQEGTYPLPEAQMDRFLLHVMIRYPDDAAELEVMRLVRGEASQQPGAVPAETVISQQAVFAARAEIQHITIAEAVERYIVALISATRRPVQFRHRLAEVDTRGRQPAWHDRSGQGVPGARPWRPFPARRSRR